MTSRREFLFGATASAGLAFLGNFRSEHNIASHDGSFEFVLHGGLHPEGLPCGRVSSRMASSQRPLTTVSLSMGAIDPSHVTLSPDGSILAICAAEGRLLNLLHIAPDGRLGEVFATHSRIFGKRPASFTFASDGTLFVDRDSYRVIDAKLLRIEAGPAGSSHKLIS